jgi:enamine deaminase RidA (YjgF/YER057c/UK114 family)
MSPTSSPAPPPEGKHVVAGTGTAGDDTRSGATVESTVRIQIANPPSLGKPLGQYSQLARVRAAEFVFLAGQLAVDVHGEIVGEYEFDEQCVQVFANIRAALDELRADWRNIVQFTTYLVDPDDIETFMAYRLRMFPTFFADGAYPPNTLLIVDRLVKEQFLVEVQCIIAL